MDKIMATLGSIRYNRYSCFMQLSKSDCYDLLIDLYLEGKCLQATYFANAWERKFGIRFSVWVKTDFTLDKEERQNILDYYKHCVIH